MKTQTVIKSGVMASLLIAGMNIVSSCESCSRKEETHTETTKYVTNTDTVYVDSSSTDTGNSGMSGATGSGTGHSSSATGKSGSGSSSSTSTGSSSATKTTGKKGLTEDEITDEIENSSKTPRDASGKPINSGGTSGTGMGTGTGSTGNNSRVSKAEDQKGN